MASLHGRRARRRDWRRSRRRPRHGPFTRAADAAGLAAAAAGARLAAAAALARRATASPSGGRAIAGLGLPSARAVGAALARGAAGAGVRRRHAHARALFCCSSRTWSIRSWRRRSSAVLNSCHHSAIASLDLAHVGAQAHEVEGGAEARLLDQAVGRGAAALVEARLHHPDLAHVGGQLAAARHVADARIEHVVDRVLQRRERRLAALAVAAFDALRPSRRARRPTARRPAGSSAPPACPRRRGGRCPAARP